MTLTEKITAEFVAQIDEQLARVGDELASINSRLIELQSTADALHSVKARLLGDAARPVAAEPGAEAVEEPAPQPAPEPRTGKMWREEELAILREHFPLSGAPGVRKHLPHRTDHAIWTKAAELGLRPGFAAPDSLAKPRGPKGDAWTEEEDQAVRDLWPTERAACYQELSHRSLKAVDMRAYKLGLRAGDKQRPTAAVQPFGLPKRNASVTQPTIEESPEFRAQLERVRNGAPISERPVIRKADPAMTLGGVTQEAL